MKHHLTVAGLLLSVGVLASDWPQMLGPTRDGVVPGASVASFPEDGPARLWSRAIGAGFAGPAVVGDHVLLFHRQGTDEVLEAFDAASGETQWRSTTPTRYRDDFGFDNGPRVVPTVVGEHVLTVGAEGELTAWSLEDGKQLWQRDTRREFDVPKGFFGVATAPLVIDGRVLLNVGGSGAGIVAFDLGPSGDSGQGGKTLWKVTDDEQSYSSPTVALVGGKQLALFFTREGLVALDPEDGSVFTRFAHKTRIRSSVNAATPLVIGDRVFLSAEYGAGAVLLQLPERAGVEPTVLWKSSSSLNNHYATSVHRDGVLYGFHGRQESGPDLRAVELKTGEVLWSERRFGAGSILLQGDRLLVLSEGGELSLIAASPRGFDLLGRATVVEGLARAYPAVADGRLFARGSSELVAVQLAAAP